MKKMPPAKLRKSTTVFLVGNIEATMDWCKKLGFDSQFYPPGFAILPRDDIDLKGQRLVFAQPT